MKLDDLNEILDDTAFNRWPLEQTQAAAAPDDKWWQVHDRLVENEVEVTLWTAAQFVALLFETYPNVIKTVQPGVSVDVDRDQRFADHRLLVNGVYCDPDYNEFEDEDGDFLGQVDDVDESRVFNAAVSALNDLVSSHLLGKIEEIDSRISTKFTSAAQAQRMAADHAPAIRAWVDSARLADLAAAARPDESNQVEPGAQRRKPKAM
jgi:hypothetical protein